MWPSSRKSDLKDDSEDDEGCTAHHYPDEWSATKDTRASGRAVEIGRDDQGVNLCSGFHACRDDVEWLDTLTIVTISRRFEKVCEHEGCNERNSQWRKVGYLNLDEERFTTDDDDIVEQEQYEDVEEVEG